MSEDLRISAGRPHDEMTEIAALILDASDAFIEASGVEVVVLVLKETAAGGRLGIASSSEDPLQILRWFFQAVTALSDPELSLRMRKAVMAARRPGSQKPDPE